MAGLGQEAVVPIRPDLATNLQPLQLGVQQSAVALMADSFRQGQISVDDIISRYGEFAKKKERKEIQGLDEFISPAAIQTRQNQQAALNTEAILKSSPEYIASREAEMQATINSAQAGSYPDMLKAAVGLGFFPQNRDATWTDAKKQEIAQLFSDARNYKAFSEKSSRDAKRFLPAKEPFEKLFINAKGEQERTVESPTGEDVNYFDENNQFIPKEVKFAADRAAGMSAEDWVRAGRPAYDPYGSLVAERAAPAKAQVEPTDYDETVRKFEKKADGSTVETVTERTPRRVTKQEITPIERKLAPKPTDVQTRALQALPLVNSAESLMAKLKTEGYDVANWTTVGWDILNVLPETLSNPVKSGHRQDFESAVRSFDEGMLRLVSGASIANSERKSYRSMFFPLPGDTASLVQEKERLRSQVAASAAEIAKAGGHFDEGSPGQKNVQGIFNRAVEIENSYGGATTSTQAGRPAMGGTGERKIIDLPGVGRGYYDAATKKFHPVQ